MPYATSNIPIALVTADFNYDGKLDLVAAANGSDQVAIHMGLGNGTFQPGAAQTLVDEPFWAKAADFNSDGKLDLAVPFYGSDVVGILLGNGNGTFQPRTNYPAGSFPTSVDAGDLNGDGKLDLVVVNNLGTSARVLLGNGNGTFQAGVNYPITQSFGVALGDFNGDGKLDVAASGYVAGVVSVLLGNGDGTLQPRVDYAVGPNPYNVVLADFDRDGNLDIATPAYGANYVTVLFGNGAGTFLHRVDVPTGSHPVSVATADFNMDGKLDLAVAITTPNPDTSYSVGVVHGNADRSFQSQVAYTVGNTPRSVITGDFDRNGTPDLAVANEQSASLSILLNTDIGPPVVASFSPTMAKVGETVTIVGSNFSTTPANNEVWFGEVRATVSAASSTQLTVTVPSGAVYSPIRVSTTGRSGLSAGYFAPRSAAAGNLSTASFATPTLTSGGYLSWSTVADIDGDGRVDVVSSNFDDSNWKVFRNNVSQGNLTLTQAFPANSLSAPYVYPLSNRPQGGAVGDLDGDGKLDVVVTDYQQNTLSLFRNMSSSGNVAFGSRVPLVAGTTPIAITISDVDGDGRMDLLVANSGYVGSPSHADNRIAVYRNRASSPGNFDFEAPRFFTVGTGPYGVKAVDLNGDGKVEIVAGSLQSRLVTILTNQSTGPGVVSFGNRVDISVNLDVYDVIPGDFNGDGRIDLAVSNYNPNAAVLYNNVTSGVITASSFSSFVPLIHGQATRFGSVGDMDGDSDVDLVLNSDSGWDLAVYVNNSPVAGSPPIGFTGFSLPTGQDRPCFVNIVDFDGDGRNDIVSATPNGGQISLQRNIITTASVGGITWQDLDNDGIQDAGEPRVAGAVVELYSTADGIIGNGDDVSLGTRITSASGNYTFASVPSGSYYLEFRTPVGFTFTTLDAGGNDTLDSDANASTGRTAIFSLGGGQTDTSRDAGLVGASPAFGWALRAGSSANEHGAVISHDAAGNSYSFGTFNNSVDFDSGPGTTSLTPVSGNADVFLAQYTAAGALVWVRQFSGPGAKNGYGVTFDSAGNIYLTGEFANTLDVDPTSIVQNLTSTGGRDAFIIKLNSSGKLIWAKNIGGGADDVTGGVVVDSAGNIFVGGVFGQTADFDPGPGNSTLTTADSADIFVAKYTSSGQYLWAHSIGTSGTDYGGALVLASDGSVVVNGHLGGPGYDGFVSRYDTSGNQLWFKQLLMNNPASAGIASISLAIDAQDGIYSAGYFSGTVDFDPGPAQVMTASQVGYDSYILKLNINGQYVWSKTTSGPEWEILNDVKIDPDGKVRAVGYFQGTVDFDPGPSTTTLTATSSKLSGYLWDLDRDGNFIAARSFVGNGDTRPFGITFNANGEPVILGTFAGSSDFDPGSGAFSLSSAGNDDFFLATLHNAAVSARVWQDTNNNGVQDSGEPGIAGAVAELLNPVDGIIGNGNDVSLGTSVTDAAGNYNFPDVIPGSYYIEFRTPVGFSFTTQDAGGNDALDSDANTATGRTAIFSLGGGTSDITRAAGLVGAAPDFGWALPQSSTARDEGHDIATDSAGNLFVTGFFSGTVDFDPGPGTTSLTTAGDADIYVAKYTSAGALVWVRRAGGTGMDHGNRLDVDGSGNVVVTGLFNGTFDIDPGAGVTTLSSAGMDDIFVAKFTGDGALAWAYGIGGSGVDHGLGITTDSDGNVLATGYFYNATVDFDPSAGSAPLTSTDSEDAFIVKFSPAGQFQWARSFSGNQGESITTDTAGNVYTTGFFTGTVDFNPGAGISNLTCDGSTDVFVSKLTPSGDFVWARAFGGTGTSTGYGIGLNAASEVYVTGWFLGPFDNDSSPAAQIVSPVGSNDDFVAKLDANGNQLWIRTFGGAGSEEVNDLEVSSSGDVYLAGLFTDTADFDPSGNTFQFTSASAGVGDAFLAVFDTSGSFVTAERVGGADNDRALGVALDASNNAYITGFYGAVGDFDPSSGTYTLNNSGSLDAFVARFNASGSIGNRVWNDLDGDGIQDAGEPGMSGVTVSIYTQALGGMAVATTTTNGSGQYTFNALAPQTYYAEVTLPNGYILSPQDQGSDDAVDSDFNRTSYRTGPVLLSWGQAVTSVDAGLYQPVTISGRKYNDLNGDGSDLTTSVVVIQPDVTSGQDTFNSRGGTGTENRAFDNHGGQSEFVVGMTGASGQIERTLIRFANLPALAANQVLLGARLGLTPYAGVGSAPVEAYRMLQSWVEGNGTATANAGSSWQTYDGANAWPGISGFRTLDGGGYHAQSSVISTPMASGTLVNGIQNWLSLDKDVVEGWMTGAVVNNGLMLRSLNENSGSTSLNIRSSEYTVAADRPALELTIRSTEPGLAGWTIYVDLDNDGQLDANEPFDITDADGEYSFADLPAGNYTIREVQQPGWVQTAPSVDAYLAMDLGTLGGSTSIAYGISGGQIVGTSSLPGDSATHAFLWTAAGGMVDLGTLGGANSWAQAVENGQVVGISEIVPGDDDYHAFRWTQAGGMVDMGTFGGSVSRAHSISGGQIVGEANITAGNFDHVFSWTQAAGMLDLGTLGGSHAHAFGVDNGTFVGRSDVTGNSAEHAFKGTVATGLVDLGTLGGTNSVATAIRGNQIVGQSQVTGNSSSHAFLWTQAGGMQDLGTLGGNSIATATNGTQVVGWSNVSSATHATLWSQSVGIIDINPRDWTNTQARGIGADGSIVGVGINPSGQNHAFRLVPNLSPGAHILTLAAGAVATGRDFGNQVAALQVVSLTGTATGFVADFNRDLNPAQLNLYDEAGAFGPADVTLTGNSTGAVRGSVVVDPGLRRITFIATSGVLPTDNYSVVLKSGANAFKDSQGGLLDGNRDGTTGDSYLGNLMLTSPASGTITLTAPNFTRGFGQPVNVPASAASGLPITISNAQGVKSASFMLHYNPALLSITGVAIGAGISGSAMLDTSVPGIATITVTSASQLSATSGATTLVYLTASVPSNAPYASKQILDLTNIHLFDTSPVPVELPSIDDDGIHIAAYFGDANGSQTYNAPDATAAQRLIVGINTGFLAYQLADPYLVADINGNGQVQSDDVTQIQRAIVGLSTPNIPSIPIQSPPATGGPDPIISIPQSLTASVGETIAVPVEILVTEPTGITLAGADIAIVYDSSTLELSDADVGQLLIGFGLSVNNTTPGLVRLSLGGAPLDLAYSASGVLATLQFSVIAGAGTTSSLNLLASSVSQQTALYDATGRALTLSPAPTNADDDEVDGLISILGNDQREAASELLAVDMAFDHEDDFTAELLEEISS